MAQIGRAYNFVLLSILTVVAIPVWAGPDISGPWEFGGGEINLESDGQQFSGVATFPDSPVRLILDGDATHENVLEGLFRFEPPGERPWPDEVNPPVSEGAFWAYISPKQRYFFGCRQANSDGTELPLSWSRSEATEDQSAGLDLLIRVWRLDPNVDWSGKRCATYVELNSGQSFPGKFVAIYAEGTETPVAVEKSDSFGMTEFPNFPYGTYVLRVLNQEVAIGMQIVEADIFAEVRYIHAKADTPEGWIPPKFAWLNIPPGSAEPAEPLAEQPLIEGEEPCTEPNLRTYFVSADYHLVNARAFQQEAANYFALSGEMADRAAQWRALAQSADDGNSADLAAIHRDKAAEFEAQSARYADLAAERSQRAQSELVLAASADAIEANRVFHSSENDCPFVDDTRVRISQANVETFIGGLLDSEEPQKMVCGPDITDNVLAALQQTRVKFNLMNPAKKAAICTSLVRWPEGEDAWDIGALSPTHAPRTEEQRLEDGWTQPYSEYLAENSFWLDHISDQCAIPHNSICRSSVEFLGRCVHAQIANYVLWGFVNQLCQTGYYQDDFFHWARTVVNGTPDTIYSGQVMMTQLGRAVASSLDAGDSIAQSEQSLMDKFIELELSFPNDPVYSSFHNRNELQCELLCQPTPAEQFGLDNWDWSVRFGNPR